LGYRPLDQETRRCAGAGHGSQSSAPCFRGANRSRCPTCRAVTSPNACCGRHGWLICVLLHEAMLMTTPQSLASTGSCGPAVPMTSPMLPVSIEGLRGSALVLSAGICATKSQIACPSATTNSRRSRGQPQAERSLLTIQRRAVGERFGDIWIARIGHGDRRGGRSDSRELERRGRVDASAAVGTTA